MSDLVILGVEGSLTEEEFRDMPTGEKLTWIKNVLLDIADVVVSLEEDLLEDD